MEAAVALGNTAEDDNCLTRQLRDLPQETAELVLNLSRYNAPVPEIVYPSNKLAGVLVLLHFRSGELHVTLTTRSLKLRSHPGDVALPGGRFEAVDPSIEQTALREANEEIGLPLGPHLVHVTTLSAFTSRTLLVVVPSVYYLTDTSLVDSLKPNPDEVDEIFTVPLLAFLGLATSNGSTTPNRRSRSAKTSKAAFEHSFVDFVWLEEKLYRLHIFSSPSIPRPVTGLTADILIMTALVARYGLSHEQVIAERGAPDSDRLGFARRAEGQQDWSQVVKVALSMPPGQYHPRDQRSSAT